MFPVIAVVAALGGAIAFAVSSVIEQHVTHEVTERRALDPRLLLDLVREPAWVGSIGLNIAGLALQITALHFGPLALVQPILVSELIFAVIIAAVVIRHRPPDRIMFAGVLCCAAGLAGFLAIAQPSGGTSVITPLRVAPLAAALAAVLALCLFVALFGRRRARPLAMALACGILYGVDAFLFKELTGTLSQGVTGWASLWPLYVVVIVAPVAFLLNENAFQEGILLAPVLAIITIADPLVSIGIAYLWLNEQIAGSPAAAAGEVICLAVMTFGIIVLAHRAPQVSREFGLPPAPRAPQA